MQKTDVPDTFSCIYPVSNKQNKNNKENGQRLFNKGVYLSFSVGRGSFRGTKCLFEA